MKKKLNIRIEEVEIDQELQVAGMFGGPCGGGGGSYQHGSGKYGGLQGGTKGAQNAANLASSFGIGNIGSIANNGVPETSGHVASFDSYEHPGAKAVRDTLVETMIEDGPVKAGRSALAQCYKCHFGSESGR